MGRPLYSEEPQSHPSGFFLEANNSLLTALWVALALEKHPEVRNDPHDLEHAFDTCKQVTWADFWRAFPYKLRECGNYIDELDALGLLLSSSASKQRFQRYFEEYARTNSSRPSNGAPCNLSLQQQLVSAQRPVVHSNSQPSAQQPQQYSSTLPLRYRRQYQRHFSPQQQHSSRQSQAVQVSLPGAAAATARHPVAYVPPPAAATAFSPANASAGAAAEVRRAGREQLSGRRRTWYEVCDDVFAPSTSSAAANTTSATMAATAPSQTAGGSLEPSVDPQQQQQSEEVVDNSNMWRAVHDWLTSEDEALLVIVARMVPYSYEGLLRPAAEVKQQLQQLADCRPVPDKVVSAVADRLAASADNNLVCLVGNGPGRKAAAAAAALSCSKHTMHYISLAGLYKSEDIQTAILQGIFTEDHLRSQTPETPDIAEPTAAAATSASADQTAAAAAEATAAAAAVGAMAATSTAALHDRVRLELRQHVWDAQQTLRAVVAALSDDRRDDAMLLMSQVAAPAAAAFGALRPLVTPQLEARIARLQSILAEFGAVASTGDYGRVMEAVRVLSQETEACTAALEADAAAAGDTINTAAPAAAAAGLGGAEPAAALDLVQQQIRLARTLTAAQTGVQLYGSYLRQVQMADQQQQQQQHLPDPSESDSEPEEGLDRLMGTIHAGLGGFDFTQRRARTIRVPRPTMRANRDHDDLPDRGGAILQFEADRVYVDHDHDQEDHDGSDGSDGGSGSDEDDGQDLGTWRSLNPAATAVAAFHSRRILALMAEMGHGGRDTRCAEQFTCGEQFSAMLTLLGACSKQPMVLLLDEADSALIAEEGKGFTHLLLRVMSMLPQAVVVLMSSFKADISANSAVHLRQLGQDVRYELSGGDLDIVCYKVLKTHRCFYHRCFV